MKKFDESKLELISHLIVKFGHVYNDYECIGRENIPSSGPALIVFYHGLMPLDAWYFGLEHFIKTRRLIRGLGDRWLFKTPLMKQLVESVGGVEGDYNTALQLLKEGHLVGVSPGGVREAISGTSNNYKLIWGKRQGFAKLALEAKVKIIPGFTQNVEELYRAPFADTQFFQQLYEKTRLPLVPIVGLGPLPFPVKLKTIIGKPIEYDKTDNPESLVEKTRLSLEQLIKTHQPKNTSILEAVKKRFI